MKGLAGQRLDRKSSSWYIQMQQTQRHVVGMLELTTCVWSSFRVALDVRSLLDSLYTQILKKDHVIHRARSRT
jgi:hypothetical protein